MENAAKLFDDSKRNDPVVLCDSAYQAVENADALVLATEWNEFKQLDFDRIKQSMHQPVILDGRNLWDPEKMMSRGFLYYSVGRGNYNKENDARLLAQKNNNNL